MKPIPQDYRDNMVGTKTSVTDDAMQNYLKDTQAKITGIGYKQKTVSSSSRPTSMLSESSIVLEDDIIQAANLASETDSGFEESTLKLSDKEATPVYNPDDDVFGLMKQVRLNLPPPPS